MSKLELYTPPRYKLFVFDDGRLILQAAGNVSLEVLQRDQQWLTDFAEEWKSGGRPLIVTDEIEIVHVAPSLEDRVLKLEQRVFGADKKA